LGLWSSGSGRARTAGFEWIRVHSWL